MNESDTSSSVFVGGGREQKEERLHLFVFYLAGIARPLLTTFPPRPGQGQARARLRG